MQFQPVETGGVGTLCGLHKLRCQNMHVFNRHSPGHLVVVAVGHRAGRYQRPVVFWQRFVYRLPAYLGRTFRAAVSELQAYVRLVVVDKTRDAFKGL